MTSPAEAWNTVLKTALLGTDRRTLDPEDLPQEIASAIPAATQTDHEHNLLMAAAFLTVYHKAARIPYYEPESE